MYPKHGADRDEEKEYEGEGTKCVLMGNGDFQKRESTELRVEQFSLDGENNVNLCVDTVSSSWGAVRVPGLYAGEA